MPKFMREKKQRYTDLATVESQRNDLTSEEFPEGPYGANITSAELGKSTPWRDDQRSPNAFSYENRTLHESLPREYPGEDEPSEDAFNGHW